jgi:hypothetical protein
MAYVLTPDLHCYNRRESILPPTLPPEHIWKMKEAATWLFYVSPLSFGPKLPLSLGTLSGCSATLVEIETRWEVET